MKNQLFSVERVSIERYYELRVEKLNPLFKALSFSRGKKLAICPFHEDTDASMGLLRDKHNPERQVYNCFGCQAAGDIVDFHRGIEAKYHKRFIDDRQALFEVAELFGVVLDESKALELEAKRERDKENLLYTGKGYSLIDFKNDILDIKLSQGNLSILEFSHLRQTLREKGLFLC